VSRRTIFFVSDQTGVTAETMGHSLLTQFKGLDYRTITLPFINTVAEAEEAARRIDAVGAEDGVRPIVFTTLVEDNLRRMMRPSSALILDFFEAFLGPMEAELKMRTPAGARMEWPT
jgi:[pyruvate, water dikinase]-phosphate phosphotransferase / [pyruvate, water dikinase] kinase